MKELISKVYILHIKQIEENDALIYVLDEKGNVIRLKALGFFKNYSKNRQAITVSSFVQVEFFQNIDFPNTGKLKKGLSLQVGKPKNIQHLNVIELIRSFIMQYKKIHNGSFKIIEKIINDFEYNSFNIIYLFHLINKIIQNENMFFELRKCSICKKNDKISGFSLKDGGLTCSNCDFNNENKLTIKIIKKIMILFMADNIDEIKNIILDFEEEKILKIMYKNYLSDSLGWNVKLLDNI